ncbi:MAG: trypsin-like peptidase domain-containing protein [Candidatus Gracilibacteria bacterium]|nr:trypsin-like peptidase domain-containing protein [Candidatus Gracilibacteria bacterium]
MNTQKKSTALLVVLSLISGFAGGALSNRLISAPVQYSDGGKTIVQPVQMKLVNQESQTIDTIQAVTPSVVSIVLTQELQLVKNQQQSPFDLFFNNDPLFNQFFGQTPQQPAPQTTPEETDPLNSIRQQVGGGSGFILSEEGLILTNRHVVSRDDVEYTVILNNGDEFKAEVVSRDLFNDIAVIKILAEDGAELPKLNPIRLGNSSELKIGQSVIAIGNALAEFENSATTGIISAKGREIVASDGQGRGENLSGLIQTDAAINPGNSGGPLINLAGEVVGVNTAIAAGANGIGFAIPIDDVKAAIESIKTTGRIVRPILGVMFTMLTPELAKELELEAKEGAVLRGDGKNFAVLPGKPADKAGLLERDIIIEVNGVKINIDTPLQKEISKYLPGDVLKVKYIRKGEERTTEITLEEANYEELKQ